MALSAAERQAKRRKKLKTAGRVLFHRWVTKTQAEQIKALLAGVTYHPPTPSRRKRRKLDPVAESNREIFETHKIEIRRRLATGEKPSAIAAWLAGDGFHGSGATLNGFLKG